MGMRVREFWAEDRCAVQEALGACAVFTEEEVRVALEVLDEGLAGGLAGDYPLFVVEIDGQVRGYVCVGKTPLTAGTWHLYWICVHPEAQGIGAGLALQLHAEEFVRGHGGERIVLETSGQKSYERTRLFYKRAGYCEVGRIRDFYKPGDDCVIFSKELKA
jgi:ribosomal protein S18 acetylase RimI-like enzyme